MLPMLSGLKQLGLKLSPAMVIRYFARRYLAGFEVESALNLSRELYQQRGVLSTVDLLGEEATDQSMIASARSTYLKLIESLAGDPVYPSLEVRPTISLKPSGLITSHDDESGRLALDQLALIANLEEVAQAAQSQQVNLTIDMEDHRWTTTTLEAFSALIERGYSNVGVVLQSRLFRTPDDIEALPEGARVRMVIGVYREPAEIAIIDKPKMKEALLTQCARLFERGATVELASHDEQVITRFFRELVIPRKIPSERYEVQMLLGVPRNKVIEQLVQGSFCGLGQPVRTRLYVPFALSAVDGTAYCRRRLIENPDLVTYGLANMLRRG